MKKIILAAFMVAVSCVYAQATASGSVKTAAKATQNAKSTASAKKTGKMTIEEARTHIQKVISNKSEMTAIMKQLSAADQKTFVAEVMAAIIKYPESPEERTAMCLNVARAALDGAEKGNVTEILSEIYATAPVTALPVITESLAENVFNRAADPSVTYTDAQYVKIAQNVMQTVNERLESVEDSSLRSGFAGLMLIKASNSETEAIKTAIVETLPQQVQEKAANEWYPAALATSEDKSYEPMLGVADQEVSRPVTEMVLRISGPQTQESLLADLTGANTDAALNASEVNPVVDAVQSPITVELPNLGNGGANATVPSKQETNAGKVDSTTTSTSESESEPEPEPEPEPKPYPYQ